MMKRNKQQPQTSGADAMRCKQRERTATKEQTKTSDKKRTKSEHKNNVKRVCKTRHLLYILFTCKFTVNLTVKLTSTHPLVDTFLTPYGDCEGDSSFAQVTFRQFPQKNAKNTPNPFIPFRNSINPLDMVVYKPTFPCDKISAILIKQID